MRVRATMKDVAALSGVSLKTVSRVVNGETGVSEDLIQRVQSAVAQLDYRHNLAASNLRRGHRTGSIGVLLHDLRNPFSATLLRAIEDRARPAGVAVLSSSLDDLQDREASMVEAMVSRRVDGLVLMPTGQDQSYLFSEIRAGLAVVAVDRPARGIDVDTVLVDNAGGAQQAVAQLIALGHRRIACLSDSELIWTAGERRKGYVQAMSAAGLERDERLMVANLRSSAEATQVVLELLDGDEPPTAIFAARNDLTVGVVRALRQRAAQRTVALIGFDDFPMADVLEPAVTVVAQDLETLGARAGDLLFARMQQGSASSQRVVIPTTLMARESGAIRPLTASL
jgi:LacI family transcriptional regulator